MVRGKETGVTGEEWVLAAAPEAGLQSTWIHRWFRDSVSGKSDLKFLLIWGETSKEACTCLQIASVFDVVAGTEGCIWVWGKLCAVAKREPDRASLSVDADELLAQGKAQSWFHL